MFPGFIYSVSEEGVWVHLYASSIVNLELPNGPQITLHQETSYPWEGHVTIEVQPAQENLSGENPFSLFLRLPGWLYEDQVVVKINGEVIGYPTHPGTYLEIHSAWQGGDQVDIDFPMEVHYLESHPLVVENTGRVAITRGPLVYCLEEADNQSIPLSQVMIDRSSQPSFEFQPGLLGGVVQLTHKAHLQSMDPEWERKLYRPSTPKAYAFSSTATEVRSIPYFAWANRQPGEMQVWTLFL